MAKRIDELALRDLRATVYYDQDGRCSHCGTPLDWNTFQLAHRLPQRAWCLAKWGAAVIHHRDNFRGVCGSACNSAEQLNPNGLEAERLADEIRKEYELEKYHA